jgi:hypothetical protein
MSQHIRYVCWDPERDLIVRRIIDLAQENKVSLKMCLDLEAQMPMPWLDLEAWKIIFSAMLWQVRPSDEIFR